MSTDNFQSWVERVAIDPKHAKPLSTGEVVKSSAGEPFGAVEFVKIQKKDFVAEVGKKGNQYIFHFYPTEAWLGRVVSFYYPMIEAFEEIFKDNGEIETDWVEEMLSWALRLSGWTNHIWGDELAIRVLDVVQQRLDAWEAKYASNTISK